VARPKLPEVSGVLLPVSEGERNAILESPATGNSRRVDQDEQ
jgi:hypothetical protein